MKRDESDNLTPLMRQYWEVKSAHQDKVVLFRMGDFFEMFHDDAVQASPIIGATLTRRNKKAQDETPMCGVPHHSIAGPINKLLQAGLKVAICEQIEDPKLAKGIVKRAVTRCLSPGMVYDPETLGGSQPNYICAFDQSHLAALDATTGEAFYFSSHHSEISNLLQVLKPAEVLLPAEPFDSSLVAGFHTTSFEGAKAEAFAQWHKEHAHLPQAALKLVQYASAMQGPQILSTLSPFEERQTRLHLQISPTVIRHLELFQTYKGDVQGSLFCAVDRTKTSAGCRLLKSWLSFPLRDRALIGKRHDEVAKWVNDPGLLKQLRALLSKLGDVERRLGKISNPGCNARDLLALAESLQTGVELSLVAGIGSPTEVTPAQALARKIENTLVEEPPLSTRQGQLIRLGVSPQLDEYIDLAEHSQKALLDLELREKQATGISSLKVRYNQVFGYYIEITNTHKDKAPSHYMRKQTLANAERFVTEELSDLERRILTAKARRSDLEAEIFDTLRAEVLGISGHLLSLARSWAELDVVSSLAWLALEQNYVRPSFTDEVQLNLVASRHPVVEQSTQQSFVPNSIRMKPGGCLLLTGPNMAGKSTLMRQVAVIVILAQMGSFVPAELAELGVFERIFTRIGASDFISEGLSTFMVEMQESAEMLKEANPRSLVLLDEVGRGTSTYDGMSLAQAILEYLLETKRALVLFATHYQELTKLSDKYPQIDNAHMSIREKDGQIFFLHTLVEGPSERSYGIHVAQLAGLPRSVTDRAQAVLKGLEKTPGAQLSFLQALDQSFAEPTVPSEIKEHLKSLKELDLTTLTPLEALNRIAQWQQSLS